MLQHFFNDTFLWYGYFGSFYGLLALWKKINDEEKSVLIIEKGLIALQKICEEKADSANVWWKSKVEWPGLLNVSYVRWVHLRKKLIKYLLTFKCKYIFYPSVYLQMLNLNFCIEIFFYIWVMKLVSANLLTLISVTSFL